MANPDIEHINTVYTNYQNELAKLVSERQEIVSSFVKEVEQKKIEQVRQDLHNHTN